MFSMFLWLQLKRTVRHLPFLIVGAILLFLLTGSIAFLSAQKLYGDQVTQIMNFGVVYPEQDHAERIFVEALAEQETLKDMTRFSETTLEKGRKDLASGSIQGLLILPEGFVSGIIHGVNTPARLVLNENQALQARLLQTLTEAGAATLSVSQGALYAAYEVYTAEGVSEANKTLMNEQVNERYLALALGRDRAFQQEITTATGEMDPLTYFMASWMILFLLLMGMLEAFVMRPLGEGLKTRLAIEGIGTSWRIFTDWLRLWLIQLLLLATILVLWSQVSKLVGLDWHFDTNMLLKIFGVAAGVAAMILWVYTVTPDLLSGMLLLFALAFGLVFLSGGFIPSAFLPSFLRKIQPLMPTSGWINAMGSLLGAPAGKMNWLGVLGWGSLFYALAIFADRSREKRRTSL